MNRPSPEDDLAGGIRARLAVALRQALKGRDMVAVRALRSALAAISNAEALPPSSPPAAAARNPHFAGAVAGLGGGEADRRSIGEAEAGEIVRAEIAERQVAAGEYEQGGHADRAARLRREADVLMSAVDDNQDS